MDGDAVKLGPGGTRKPQHQLTRKRRAGVQGEEPSEPIHKSPRLGEKLIQRHRNAEGKVQTQPTRTSPRLREIQHANQQRAVHTSRIGPEQPEPPLTSPKPQKDLKRHRDIENRDLSNHDAKRLKLDDTAKSNPRIDHSKDKFVKAWLSSTDDEKPLGELDLVPADDMALPSSDGSGASAALTSSKKSDKSSVGPYDADYRESLGYRNIYIECEKPPAGLVRRAKEIITGSRSSPEVDEATAEEVKETSRQLQTKAEEDIIQQLAPSVIPGMSKVPDRRLASSAGQQWTNFVPVPLDPSILTDPLPLSRPKPDKAFGYSKKAFTRRQLATIDLLTGPLGQSYAVPYKELHFPFLDIEFKSQAKGGSHVIATNQAASAGAVVGHGLVELVRRGLGLDSLDYDEPQFFSLSMDHELAKIYVHWLSVSVEDGQYSFHVERLSVHDLRDLDGLRAVQRTAKNILDWGRGERLQMICKQLDAYREKVRVERVAAEREAAATPESAWVDTEPPKAQKQKGRKRKNSTVTITASNVQNKPATKRAPPPPIPLQSARALYDFTPEPEDEQSDLGFKKGDTIEFADPEADENGWLRGRIKGGTGRWGRVPAEYLEL